MANGMEGLFVGNSGLRAAQNAINTTANNLANVNTKGYVRQQVVFANMEYNFFKNAAISTQNMGLGVSIGDIVHARDVFLDKTYRQEAGRQSYYEAYYNAIDEVQGLYQELEGTAFKDVLYGSGNARDDNTSLWAAFQLLAENPSDSTSQSMVIQRSNLLLTRANAIYSSLSSYQSQINIQISNDIDKANDLGAEIYALNLEIQKIEAGGVETAYDLRDQRDVAIDELAALFNITYSEDATGIVSIRVEDQFFVDETKHFPIGKQVDRSTGYVTPYWPHLSNPANEQYTPVIDFTRPISSEFNTDVGEVKALVQARGNGLKNFAYLEGADPDTYATTVGMSVMEEAQAQLDQLIHGLTTAINDILCPNTTASFTVREENADGTYKEITYKNVKVLDVEGSNVGADKRIPPHELFTRVGVPERYTEITDKDGKTWYVYNEEDTYDCKTVEIAGQQYRIWDYEKGNGTVSIDYYDAGGNRIPGKSEEKPYEQYETIGKPKYVKQFISGKWYDVLNPEYTLETASQYTLKSLGVNDVLENQVNLFPHMTQTGEINYQMGAAISEVWNAKNLTIYPGSEAKFNFSGYYTEMIGMIASAGSTYESRATTLNSSTIALDNQRGQVTGVSTDEELTNMIKYQNAYNAASRYIQTVSDMLDILVTSL